MWSDEFLLYLIHVALVCHPVDFGVDTVFFSSGLWILLQKWSFMLLYRNLDIPTNLSVKVAAREPVWTYLIQDGLRTTTFHIMVHCRTASEPLAYSNSVSECIGSSEPPAPNIMPETKPTSCHKSDMYSRLGGRRVSVFVLLGLQVRACSLLRTTRGFRWSGLLF